ncbi:MAG TPA: hypothetical protein VJ723_02305 [Candidatus Angelobacter sp.]|nr:hypothetical protein [Candidatus Angelobacter sp.]
MYGPAKQDVRFSIIGDAANISSTDPDALVFESKERGKGYIFAQEHLIFSAHERTESFDIQRLDGRAGLVLYGQASSDCEKNNSDQEERHH